MNKVFASVCLTSLALSLPLCGSDLASLLVPVSQMKAEAEPVAKPEVESVPVKAAKPAPAIYVSRGELLSGLSDALKARFSADGELRVDMQLAWRPVRVKDAAWHLEIVRASGNTLSARMNVTVRILCGSEKQGEFQLPVTCSLMREVLVANKRLDRGATADISDFDVQVRDVLDAKAGSPVPSTQNLGDYDIKSMVGSGQMLFWRDIELKPTLRRGQIVEAVADEGFMHVAIKAMALEDGRAGEVINVRNLSSNKELQARIINERTVQVYF